MVVLVDMGIASGQTCVFQEPAIAVRIYVKEVLFVWNGLTCATSNGNDHAATSNRSVSLGGEVFNL
jgi:hypothetical protein